MFAEVAKLVPRLDIIAATQDLSGAEIELVPMVARESRLPGLAAWIRVLDYRVQALSEMKNVEAYRADVSLTGSGSENSRRTTSR